MADSEKRLRVPITHLAPSKWFKQAKGSSIWVAGYQMYKVPDSGLSVRPQLLDFDLIRAVFTYGSVPYLDASRVQYRYTDDGKIILQNIAQIQSQLPEGAYLLMLAPFDVNGRQGNERAVRQRIAEVVGLLVAFEGRNIAFQHMFDNIQEMRPPGQSVISPIRDLPFTLPAPDLGLPRLQAIVNAHRRISDQPEDVSNRIRLSLRWIEAAAHDTDIDAFLKYWIALETLAMPDTTNIQSINESLAAAYGCSMQEVGQTYHIGRVSSLRGRIVHDGFNTRIPFLLLEYVAAVYADVLSHMVGTACEMRAHKMITQQGLELLSLIPAA